MSHLTLEEYSALFSQHGPTDYSYLTTQYRRYWSTKDRFESTWNRRRRRLLDVGAHWLHQALLYARDGYAVSAADFPATLEHPSVQSLARSYGITLVPYCTLENPDGAFSAIASESFDVILFTEIIEHITFNPIAMWKELYRLLDVGGRIIVTTPNYYSADGKFWSVRRLLQRMGAGITVEEILDQHTYGHHWKEFSLKELLRYFEMLSPDFVVQKALYVDDSTGCVPQTSPRRFLRLLSGPVSILRPNLHLEIGLVQKERGIVATPG